MHTKAGNGTWTDQWMREFEADRQRARRAVETAEGAAASAAAHAAAAADRAADAAASAKGAADARGEMPPMPHAEASSATRPVAVDGDPHAIIGRWMFAMEQRQAESHARHTAALEAKLAHLERMLARAVGSGTLGADPSAPGSGGNASFHLDRRAEQNAEQPRGRTASGGLAAFAASFKKERPPRKRRTKAGRNDMRRTAAEDGGGGSVLGAGVSGNANDGEGSPSEQLTA